MLSAVITSTRSYAAMLLAEQLLHQWRVHPGPLVLGTALLNFPTPTADRDRTVSRRSEPSSRTALNGEQPYPWDLLQPQDAMSRHRGAKPPRRCELLGEISLLSPGYLLSFERWPFHTESPDHYDRLSSLLDLFVLQSGWLMPLHSTCDFQPQWANLCKPPLLFRRRPPQSNYPPGIVLLEDNSSQLADRNIKGGISRMAPSPPEWRLQSLPPILRIMLPSAVPSCSKGPRGLSVLPRVGGIFTSTTISLNPWLRQLPSRYAIHAGRYLTDKEFRYLRTVIVTAAVYSGFNSTLRIAANESS